MQHFIASVFRLSFITWSPAFKVTRASVPCAVVYIIISSTSTFLSLNVKLKKIHKLHIDPKYTHWRFYLFLLIYLFTIKAIKKFFICKQSQFALADVIDMLETTNLISFVKTGCSTGIRKSCPLSFLLTPTEDAMNRHKAKKNWFIRYQPGMWMKC